ncbi:MAG: hypothetical protein V8S58_01625 [Lachnospiraceae bacterium]
MVRKLQGSFLIRLLYVDEMEISKYQKILCDIGYHYETYNAENIVDDKMEVLIGNHVMEMNDDGLEYIEIIIRAMLSCILIKNVEVICNPISG